MKILVHLDSFLLKRIEKADVLYYRKAQFTAYSAILFILLMIALSVIALSYDNTSRLYHTLKLTIPIITVAFATIALVARGKAAGAAVVMASGAGILAGSGFLLQPPHLAGVSLTYFMYLDLVYASFFCTAGVTGVLFILFLTIQSTYFFLIVPSLASGIIAETAKTAYYDGSITLACVYMAGFFTNRFMQQTIQHAEGESARNVEQLLHIRNLMDTIKSVANELRNSINTNTLLIDSYTDNARSQAASVEELTSAIEEISAGTENVAGQTIEQGAALRNLIDCLNTLAMSIGLTEHHSREINELFDSFVQLAENGKQASEDLDRTNRQISHNSAEVETVTEIIEDFFERINLLALNASIEAARAGEYGRGFAVVAGEISKLADTSQQQLKQISSLIEKSRNDVEQGNRIIVNILLFIQNLLGNFKAIQGKSLDMIQEITSQKDIKRIMNERVEAVKNKSGIIELSMQEQKTAINDIVASVESTSAIVQKNAENTELLRENSEKIQRLAEELNIKFA